MNVLNRCALALVVLMAAGCALGRAETEPGSKRVAVMKFHGAKAKQLQHLVADLVGKHHEVVSDRKYRKAARKLRAPRMRARHVRRVASKLGVDAVVQGKLVRRSRRSYTLQLLVRAGATGKTIQTFSIPVRERRMSKTNRRKLERKLASLLDEIEPVADDDDGDEIDRRRHSKRSRRARHSRRSRHARRARRARRERPPEIAEVEDEYEVEPEQEEPVVIVDKVDANGQVIDDEVPDVLK